MQDVFCIRVVLKKLCLTSVLSTLKVFWGAKNVDRFDRTAEEFFSGCLKVPLNPNCIFAFVMVKTDFKNRLLIVI